MEATSVSRHKIAVLPGNRRKSGRDLSLDKKSYELVFDGKTMATEIIDRSQLGYLVLSIAEEDGTSLPVGRQAALKVTTAFETVCDGDWTLTSLRATGGQKVAKFQHADSDHFEEVLPVIASEAVLLRSGYRRLAFSSEADREELETHFTELKDCPAPVVVTIVADGVILRAPFDFEDNRRSLEHLTVKIADSTAALQVGRLLVIEYIFLTVRYAFATEVKDYDVDFGLLDLRLPKRIYAFTNRRFDRVPFEQEVHLLQNGNVKAVGRAQNFSVAGLALEVLQDHGLDRSAEFELEVPSLGFLVRARCARSHNSDLVLMFTGGQEDMRSLRGLYSATITSPLECRRSDNYQDFVELYQMVGYAPKDLDQRNSWWGTTESAWLAQDERFPGCTVGYRKGRALSSSLGSIPISNSCVYAHSACMVQDMEGVIGFYEGCVKSLNWVNLLDGITHYMGSYATRGRFVTRLQTSVAAYARPESLTIIYMDQLFPASELIGNRSPTIEIVPANADTCRSEVAPRLREFFDNLAAPSETLSDLHHASMSMMMRRGRPVAVIIRHTNPVPLTAVNILSTTWVFTNESWQIGRDLCAGLRIHEHFARDTFQLVVGDALEVPPEYTGSDLSKPAFFTLVAVHDFGATIASFARACYQLLVKYGDAAHGELSRFLSTP